MLCDADSVLQGVAMVTGGSGKCWCPLERLYMASTVQVAIPKYVIRSHFTASSATPAHAWYQAQLRFSQEVEHGLQWLTCVIVAGRRG
jgi:hypothetical protein